MEQQTPTPEAPPSLSLSDLVLLLNVVKVTADRGAIRAEEMSAVGAVYEKLVKFLQSSGALGQQAAPAEDTETPAE
jgi:hypothetical protein